jgi:pimeloyl-ACP methyl ester carboxylesterase
MTTINYERRGAGTPLVLIHGIGSRWQMWLPVMDALAERHDVIAVDIPGFGGSPAPELGYEPGVPTLCTLLEEFWAELGIERPHVSGNSMGGQIALEFARRDTVRSVSALSPGGFLTEAQTRVARLQLKISRGGTKLIRPYARALTASALGRKALISGVVAHAERIEPEQAALMIEGAADATWFDEMLDWLKDNAFTEVTRTTIPVTIAWGSKDRLLPPRGAAQALSLFPDARYVRLENCGHVPTYDDPELVAKVMLQTAAD